MSGTASRGQLRAAAVGTYRLARRGFVLTDSLTLGAEPKLLRVLPASVQQASELTIRVLSELSESATWTDSLERARAALFRAAERQGRLVTQPDTHAVKVEDLDGLMASGASPIDGPADLSEAELKSVEAQHLVLSEWSQSLDGLMAALWKELWGGATSIERWAEDHGVRPAHARAQLARLEAEAAAQLRKAGLPTQGQLELWALLASSASQSHPAESVGPPSALVDRLLEGAARRGRPRDAPSFGVRLATVLAVLGAGILGWVLMFQGILPGAGGPLPSSARVKLDCKPACFSGAEAFLSVKAPRFARRFGVALRRELDGESMVVPLLVAPDGGSLRLPMGARSRLLAVPYPVRIPSGFEKATVVAVFSEYPLSGKELLRFADEGATESSVATSTTSVRS